MTTYTFWNFASEHPYLLAFVIVAVFPKITLRLGTRRSGSDKTSDGRGDA